ncbi:23S rRNA pseudouridine2604 synthase [Azotobacter beijerinckii]|uniref:Dual-specificity RNA pseudouridine synthase RluF n=2 Tax=Azotobacter beijerinckii TaxID=170623 RepID=A0A1H6YRR4_9GAMM|nr:23S rRNA pseudouridine2604 synthase [Azotobacter beijerinckii]
MLAMLLCGDQSPARWRLPVGLCGLASEYNGRPIPSAPIMTDPIRLSKRLVELLHCSRREAELYIEGGWVSVDGQIVEEPQFKVGNEEILLHPDAVATPVEPVTLLLHKPAGESLAQALQRLGPATRAENDHGPQHSLRRHFERITALLPLESAASGLQVFSQQRGVLRKLSEEAGLLEQEFIAEVAGQPAEGGLQLLNHGLDYQGRPIPPCKVSWQSEHHLRFALKAPKDGQIEHMCRSVGLELLGLRRIRIGRLAMAKLPVGHWRYLGERERF